VETSCRASPHPFPITLRWGYLNTFHFGHIFTSDQSPSVFLLYHLLCPQPCTYNKSNETSKHRLKWCDRGAVSNTQANPFSILFFWTSNYRVRSISTHDLSSFRTTTLNLFLFRYWDCLYAIRITWGNKPHSRTGNLNPRHEEARAADVQGAAAVN
jgi:hypothetical protein